jgi:hypothetical protein
MAEQQERSSPDQRPALTDTRGKYLAQDEAAIVVHNLTMEMHLKTSFLDWVFTDDIAAAIYEEVQQLIKHHIFQYTLEGTATEAAVFRTIIPTEWPEDDETSMEWSSSEEEKENEEDDQEDQT